MKKQILTMLACCVCTVAQAQFWTGNRLLEEIVDDEAVSNGLALGFVMGVTDANGGSNHCPPKNVTSGQVMDMVKEMLVDIPEIRHLPAAAIVEYKLNKVWPCANSKGKQS